jgi:hypothetical protein
MAAVSRTVWIGRVISLLAMPLFLYSSFMKLQGGPEFEQGMAHMGLPLSHAGTAPRSSS